MTETTPELEQQIRDAIAAHLARHDPPPVPPPAMIEPTLALQTAIRAALIANPAIAALVPAAHIRAGGTRPDKSPTIIMTDGNVELMGKNYSAQRLAWVYIDLHIWDLKNGPDAAKAIAFAVTTALDKPLVFEGCECDHFWITRAIYPRDPDATVGHGVLSVEALIRWTI